MEYVVNETPTILPPRDADDGLGSVSWISGAFVPGVMYRAKCAAAWQPGMAVGHEGEQVRMFPWVYEPLSTTQFPIQEIRLPLIPIESASTTATFMGIAVEHGDVDGYTIVAGPGSIVMCVCDSPNDVPMRTVGTWVGLSTTPGVVRSYTTAQVVTAGNAGKIIGRIVQAAGLVPGLGQTGNNFYAAVLIAPR